MVAVKHAFLRVRRIPYKAGYVIVKRNMTFSTKLLPVDRDSIIFDEGEFPKVTDEFSEENLRKAARELRETNNVVGFPTETVYGLGGSALDDKSVQSIYRVKNRPADNPLIVHVSSKDQLQRQILSKGARIPEVYENLINAFWPGPLTILLPVLPGTRISKVVTVGQDTFGVRLPQNEVARALLAFSDTPLAAPSANSSTRPSPTTAAHVYQDLHGKIPYIIDGGPCDVGVESTVVDGLVDPPMILRPGGISLEQIKRVGGAPWQNVQIMRKTAGKSEPVKTPGMKYRHYSPNTTVILFVNCGDGRAAINKYMKDNHITNSSKKVALLKTCNFTTADKISDQIVFEEALGNSLTEIARNMFKMLRQADELHVDFIFIEGVNEENEGLAIMNRLRKAATEVISP